MWFGGGGRNRSIPRKQPTAFLDFSVLVNVMPLHFIDCNLVLFFAAISVSRLWTIKPSNAVIHQVLLYSKLD